MVTQKEVSLLTNYVAREGVAISFYLNTDGSERSKGIWDIERKDMIKSARKQLEKLNVSHSYIEAAEKNLQQIEQFASAESVAPRYKSVAIFANYDENFYQIYRLPMPVKSNLTLETNFYVRPLLAMLEEHSRIGLILSDSRHARFFEIYMGEVLEHLDFETKGKNLGKPLLETLMRRDKRLMQKKEEEIRFHLSSVAELLKTHFNLRHFERLIIGARKPLGEHLARLLHSKLHDSLIGIFEIDIHAKENEVLAKALNAEKEFELQEENKLLRRITNEVERDGYAVKGVKKVMDAIRSYNVHTLAVAEDFSLEGSTCQQCGMPHLEERTCTSCGEPLFQVADIVYDIVGEAARQGAVVRHIRGANLIGSLENIAAIIKFKKGELTEVEAGAETES
ncbi:MAG: hypothetical protein ACLP05_06740 [Candidatus Kryptoniota bacterium]